MIRVCVVAIAILGATPGLGHAADPALNVGAIEAIGVPSAAHLGAYGYVTLSVAFPVHGVSLVPGVGVEYSPDASRWGFVGSFVLDVPLSAKISGDVIVAAGHDQSGAQWSSALLLVGGGIGVSIVTDQLVISPSLCMYAATDGSGWSLTPGLGVSHGF